MLYQLSYWPAHSGTNCGFRIGDSAFRHLQSAIPPQGLSPLLRVRDMLPAVAAVLLQLQLLAATQLATRPVVSVLTCRAFKAEIFTHDRVLPKLSLFDDLGDGTGGHGPTALADGEA